MTYDNWKTRSDMDVRGGSDDVGPCALCNKPVHPRDAVDTRNGYFWHAECRRDARCCDCCDKMVHRDEICRVDFSGLETWACDECRSDPA
jgi:hypothetical protein